MLDAELLRLVKLKDRKAQVELYEMYKTTWYTICLRYHRDKNDAADVLQNALINIYTKINQFNFEKGNFKSWSSKIVVNENLMYIRKRADAYRVDDIEEDISLFDESETPVEKLSAEELVKLIQKLPEGYRTVFNLYVMDGFNHHEIADMLNISVGTSKSQLFKARKFLQEKLEVLI